MKEAKSVKTAGNTPAKSRHLVYLTPELWAELQAEGKRQERSANWITVRAILAFLTKCQRERQEAERMALGANGQTIRQSEAVAG